MRRQGATEPAFRSRCDCGGHFQTPTRFAIGQTAKLKLGLMPYPGTYAQLGEALTDGLKLAIAEAGGKLARHGWRGAAATRPAGSATARSDSSRSR